MSNSGMLRCRHLLLLLGLIALAGSACADPKKASRENFETAVRDYLASTKWCLGRPNYPAGLDGIVSVDDGLVRVGLLKFVNDGMGYDLTEAGRASFTQGQGFCYGPAELVRVTNWTEPAPGDGRVVSQVTYEYRFPNIPSWATNEDLRRLVPALRPVVPAGTWSATYVLTEQGWVFGSN